MFCACKPRVRDTDSRSTVGWAPVSDSPLAPPLAFAGAAPSGRCTVDGRAGAVAVSMDGAPADDTAMPCEEEEPGRDVGGRAGGVARGRAEASRALTFMGAAGGDAATGLERG